MASEVEICNLALAHLGDSATVASIDPPEGSAQAEHCQRFYPLARDSLLDMHDWSFATRRIPLALLATNPASTWAYCYAQPNDVLNVIAVLDAGAADDTAVSLGVANAWGDTGLGSAPGVYTPQPFAVETNDAGQDVIYTNQADAVARCSMRITDTTRFSPSFVQCLAWHLASMLAGPVIKGDAGMAAAARCTAIAFGRDGVSGLFGKAAGSDANQKRTTARERHQVAWINGR